MKSSLVNVVRDAIYSDESAPDVKQLWFNGKRIENGMEINSAVCMIAKNATEKCTRDSYVFNFDPSSMLTYKEIALEKEVLFAMRCANDDRFCVLSLDDVLKLQGARENCQSLDATKQLPIKVDITSSKSFRAYVNGGGKLNPVGVIKKPTGLLTKSLKKYWLV